MSRQMQSTAKPQRKPASRRGDRRSRLARAGVGAVAAVLAGLMIFSLVYSVLPVSAAASQSSVNALRDELDEISAEKKEIEAELKDLTADKTALRAQITALDQQIAAAVEEIDVQTQLIDELSALITVKEGELEQSQREQDEQYEKMRQRIRLMYENGNLTYLEILLSADDFADFLNKYEIVSQLSLYDKEQFENLRAIKEQIAEQKAALEQDKAEQEELRTTLRERKHQLDVDRVNQAEKMIALESAEEDVKAAFEEIEEEEERINAEIKRMVAELAATTTYVGGTFSWPLPAANTTITCPYGMRTHPITGKYKLHTGVDLRASRGTNIYAANGGTVITSTYSAAYGNYVVINHGGGVSTLYAHMDKRAVSKGDTVAQGDVIGYVGSTGYSTGPHLHFEIIKNGSTIDPMTEFTKQ